MEGQKRKRSTTRDSNPDLLTVGDVAQQLRVDETTVRRWIKSGAMEAVALPHHGKRQAYRVRRTTMDKLFGSSASV